MQEETITKTLHKAERQLLLAKLTRDASGIQLHITSELFEEHFRSLTGGGQGKYIIAEVGHKFYMPSNPPISTMPSVVPSAPGYSVTGEASHGLFHGDRVNLAFLRAVGLKDGVTIKITNAVYSAEKLRKWMEQFRDGAKLYYLQAIKPVSIEVEITTREI